MDNLPDRIYFKDRASRFTRINLADAKSFGLAHPAEAVGKTDFDFFTAEHAQEAYNDEQEIIRTGQPVVDKEEKETWPDGRVTWVSTTKMPLRDAHGNIVGTFGVSHDITERRQAEKARAHLASIVESSEDAILGKSTEGVIESWNAGAERLYGYTASEAIGKSIFLLVPPDRREEVEGFLQRIKQGEAVKHHETVRLAKGGRQVDVSVTISPIKNASGEVVGASAVARDISELKRAEEQLTLLKHSIDVHYDGAYWTDTENRFIYINEAGCKALGYQREELIGKTLLDVNPKASPERLKQVWESLRSQGYYSTEAVHRRKDGSELPVELVTTYVQFKGREFSCGFARDITARKRVEQELRRVNRALRTISTGNQVIVRATEETRLLEDICGILVREGGYRMAWVGYAEHDEGKSVRPMAHAGFEDGYLQTANLTWADTERGRGPGGQAIRTGNLW